MELKLSKQVKKTLNNITHVDDNVNKNMANKVVTSRATVKRISEMHDEQLSTPKKWNFMYAFVLFVGIFIALTAGIVRLQVIEGKTLYLRSSSNNLHERTVYPNRGVITDRYGVILAENVPAFNVYIIPDSYFNEDGYINEDKLKVACEKLQTLLGEKWQDHALKSLVDKPEDYPTLYSKVYASMKEFYYLQALLIASNIDNDQAIAIKSQIGSIEGMYVDDTTRRHYTGGKQFAQIIGYTSRITADDLVLNSKLDPNEEIGRSGVEYSYNKELSGKKGSVAVETDASFNIVSDLEMEIEKVEPGDDLVLTIDSVAQNALYSAIANGVDRIGAQGASGIIQDIKTGEIIAMVSYPSFDNNQFIGGISVDNYNKLITNTQLPLFNRPIASQQPPGSIFKTLVGSSALDAGVINTDTLFYSTPDYTFTNGAHFYEYGRVGYGNINIYTALEVSSNIFFCETIRNWDMDELDKYLDKFGIGKTTGIDLPGEMPGRLPSPENKIMLAKTTNPWLESVWYPEGDSCNSVIGQGITAVTPIQAVNWTSAIANGGTLFTPHVVKQIKKADGTIVDVNPAPLQTNVVSADALSIIRRGMRETIVGPHYFLTWSFYDSKYSVAAKTGTAEFGALNEDGRYEHTHAWTIGFFPYEDPKYAFVILLEDSQHGSNSATVANEFINNFTIPE
jgi:penicillin-binding protein 2